MKKFDDRKFNNKNRSFDKNKKFDKPRYDKPRFNDEKPKRFEKREESEKDEFYENILEGRNPIREAIKAGRNIERLLVAEGEIQGSVKEIVYDAKANGAIIQEVERARLDRISQTGAHQGIIAYVAVKEYVSVDDILEYAREKGEDPFIVILDGICDPQNLGAIIRSSECAGVHGVIISKHNSVGLSATVAKTSAGAVEYTPVAKVSSVAKTIDRLKKANVWVVGADMDGENTIHTHDFSGAVAIVVGNEGKGISHLVKEKCDFMVRIPMLGKISSLNASVAGALMIYEVVRSRLK